MTDLPPFRAEPDAGFADRLERELLRRLTEPLGSTLTEVPLVTYAPETDDDVKELDLEAADRRRRPSRIHLVAAALVAAGFVAVLALVARNSRESQLAGAPPKANGLIAFVGESDDNPAKSDIYVVAPDGTGLRALTSTAELVEYAPAWSPDGSRLAFLRTDDVFSGFSGFSLCETGCQLVVVDPSTGVETFSADIPQPDGAVGGTWVPRSLAWSPDGRAIVIPSMACGIGGCGTSVYDTSASTPAEACDPRGCGGLNSVIADLETGTFTTFTPPYQAMWSPDGEWLSLLQAPIVPGPSLLLVPAELIGTGDVVDIAELPGVRPLPEDPGAEVGGTVAWMPDGSAMLVSEPVAFGRGVIDVVTVADGERRTLIENGGEPVVSPDGTQIAYVRGGVKEIWVVATDGSDPRRVTTSLSTPSWSPDGSLLLLADGAGWFTIRPDGTDRTPLGIRDHTPRFQLPGIIVGGVDWQPVPPPAGDPTEQSAVETVPPGSTRVGFIGLPPAGATASTPESGELVLYVQGTLTGSPPFSTGSRTWVYADGRMIWHRYADIPAGANERFTGFLERRLTPEGVELLRSETVSSLGLVDGDEVPPDSQPLAWPIKIEVLNGGRLVNVERAPRDYGRLVQRIHDAALWLPASAWEDREIKAYVPSRYGVCYTESDSFALLPDPAQNLLANASAPPGNPVIHPAGPDATSLALVCADLTTEELRALDEALEGAGLGQSSLAMEDGFRGPSRYSLTYRIDRGSEDIPAVERRSILVEPYLPHGQVYCQHCDIRG